MRNNLSIFLLLLILVVFFHYLFDSSYLNFGMHSDDWIDLVRYRLFDTDVFRKIKSFWVELGPHTTSQIMYIGILESLFGLNYKVFNLINISLKILATLSLYPLTQLLFKRKLLSFLTVVLYSISYSTVGSFHDVSKGTEYQAIFFMNIFLALYYYVTKKQIITFKWIFALILFFSLAILLAPPRLFPLTLLPILIEFFLWFWSKNYNLKFTTEKLLFLYLPLILLFIYHPNATTGPFITPVIHLQKILEGYWFIALTPLSGLGYMIFWDSYWVKMIGKINLDNFSNYLIFLSSRLIVVFGLISAVLGFITLGKRKKLIFLSVALYFILAISMFFLATNHLQIVGENRRNFDPNTLYSVFVGLFIVVFSLSCYIKWLKQGGKDNLILALWIGPLFSLHFIFWNWLFADSFLTFAPSQEYLTVPAIGVSLIVAALLTIFYDKMNKFFSSEMSLRNLKAVVSLARRRFPIILSLKTLSSLLPINKFVARRLAIKSISFYFGKLIAICVLILIFIPLYTINRMRTTDWMSIIVGQNNASRQQNIQQKIRGAIKGSETDGNKLVFFDWTNDKLNDAFYSEILNSSFPSWTHYNSGRIATGCITTVFDKRILSNSVTERSGEKGFVLPGVCLQSSQLNFFTDQQVLYNLEDFYAFEIRNNNVGDIKETVLKSIGIN